MKRSIVRRETEGRQNDIVEIQAETRSLNPEEVAQKHGEDAFQVRVADHSGKE